MRKTFPTLKVSSTEQIKNPYHKPMKKFGSPFVLILLLLIGVSGALAIYFYQQLSALKANPQAIAQNEASELVERVSKLIVLPEDETPTIATVQNPEQLLEQPFFARAKKGDKVLIYTNARKAILYDPVNNKIVEVAPVNIGDTQTVNPPLPTQSPPAPASENE